MYTPDDVGDDESHWQDRVSSGFDRLVAFASTELTKSRRSIEEAATSPDSGINQSGSDCRFLSSSSSSSQLDLPSNSMRATMVPLIKSSPAEPLDSPPLSEAELPRTPSPSPSASPPMLYGGKALPQQHHLSENHLKIPLKYQRQSKSSSHHQKHYKKKFRERTWEYDCDESVGSDMAYGHETAHHKSKFRPKGKDWDWRSENHRNHDTDQIC